MCEVIWWYFEFERRSGMSPKNPTEVYFAIEISSGKWLSVNADGRVVQWNTPEPLTDATLQHLLDLVPKEGVTCYKLSKLN